MSHDGLPFDVVALQLLIQQVAAILPCRLSKMCLSVRIAPRNAAPRAARARRPSSSAC